MIKKTMTYTDFDGNERKEDFYFNLTEAEIAEMQMSAEGGLEQMIRQIVDAKDTPAIIKMFKKILLKSYGVKSPDGRYFEKSEDLSRKFSYTQAYSDLFIKLSTDDKEAIEFVNGIVPVKAQENNVTALPAGN